MFVTSIHNGDCVMVQGADFAKGCSSIDLNVASLYGGKIEIRIDKKDGPVVGIADVATSGEGDVWKTITAKVKSIKGVHDLYFIFKGEKDLFNFDWWQFKE